MNIIVKPNGSSLCYCRPDTTWERENKDFYSPECVNEVLWAPVAFARVSKAGKCIGQRFVQRYYDGVGCGILMYCVTTHTGPVVKQDVSACVDHTSILPMPLYGPEVLEDRKEFIVTKNGNNISVIKDHESSSMTVQSEWRHLLEEAICSASELTSLRIGDFVVVELAPLQNLALRKDSKVAIKGTFCENDIFDFNIIF